jgi:hypothetical protein
VDWRSVACAIDVAGLMTVAPGVVAGIAEDWVAAGTDPAGGVHPVKLTGEVLGAPRDSNVADAVVAPTTFSNPSFNGP